MKKRKLQYTITVPIPNFYLVDNLVTKLAKIVRLDVHEASNWMQNVQVQPVGKRTTISVDVPNVWLCIDLMQGWAKWWEDPIVNIGGTIGQAVSYLTTYGKEEVFCYSIDEMYSAFKTYQHQIWGFVLYAHGNETGVIQESNRKHHTTQAKLMSAVDQQGYKLAKIYLMQCYSGRNKDLEIRYTYEELWNFYLDNQERYQKDIEYWRSRTRAEFMKAHFDRYKEKYTTRGEGLTYKNGYWNENEIYFLLETQWGTVWGKRTVKGKPDISYQGVNGLGIDWGFLENN